MKAAEAKSALVLANELTARILSSIHRIATKAPEHAALRYRRSALEILDPLSEVVFALWARFPELEPKSKPGVVYYDPDKWNITRAEARRAARELARVESRMGRLIQLLDTGERVDRPLKTAATNAQRLTASAGRAVLRQDPAFRKAERAKVRQPLKRSRGRFSSGSRTRRGTP